MLGLSEESGETTAATGVRRTAPNLLVGACGSISVLNLHQYLITLRPITNSISVILTRAANSMIVPSSLQAVTGRSVFSDEATNGLPVPHINLATWADMTLVLPATADMMAKVTHGIADDLLSTTLLAARWPLVIVPGMNNTMWSKPSVQRNVEMLREDGHVILCARHSREHFEASSGDLAQTELMPSPQELYEEVQALLERMRHISTPISRVEEKSERTG